MKIRVLFSILIILFSFSFNKVEAKTLKYILIDPGHGGMDPGCNIGNIKESDIVLDISYKIREVLIEFGYNVILTRETKESLCMGKYIKKQDTEKRINIINNHNVLAVLSIHLNKFSIEKYHGAQVFYNDNNEKSIFLASCVQEVFKSFLNNTTRNIKYIKNNYLLNRINVPSCIIECGFISNEEELKLLLSEEYQYKIALSILYSLNDFFYVY